MTDAESAAPARVPGKDVVRADAPGLGVVIHIPLDTQVVHRFKPQARDERRKIAGVGEEGDSAQVESAGEDVAAAWNERSAEPGIDVEALRDLPACPLAGSAVARFRRGGDAFPAFAYVEPLGE